MRNVEDRNNGQKFSFCRGSFGEILQGSLPNGKEFLVTLPINLYSKALFVNDRRAGPKSGLNDKDGIEIKIKKSNFLQTDLDQELLTNVSKAKKMSTLILKYFNLPIQGQLFLESNIPVGKGMASSTADLVATARAIATCFNLFIPARLLESFLREIEPSDGLIYDDQSVIYFHRKIELLARIGKVSPLVIVFLDEGGSVDTVQFNNSKDTFQYTGKEKVTYKRMLRHLQMAFANNDLRKLGEVATESACLNQKYCKKRYLQPLMNISKVNECLGVITTHSGTCTGILLSKQDSAYENKKMRVINSIKELILNSIENHQQGIGLVETY